MKKYILTLMAAAMAVVSVSAAEVSGGVDLVSTYTWRGIDQTGPALQPGMAVSFGDFSVSAWGSNPLAGGAKELDATIGYAFGAFSVSVTDYWWEGESSPYTGWSRHQQEVTLGYEHDAFSITWSTMVAGELDKLSISDDGEAKASYSTYICFAYPFSVGDVDCSASIGITPWAGAYADGFNVASVAVRFDKEVLSLPLFVEASVAPAQNDAYLVAGMSFAF